MFCIFDDVPFERHGFGNRNQIKTHAGVQWLTVPVHLDDHLAKPAHQVRICNEHSWRRKHLRSIELAYCKAPFFERYIGPLREIYAEEWTYLSGLNRALLGWLLFELGIQVEMVTASEQGFSGSKSDLVLDMCKKLGASEYIFGSNGEDYCDIEAFAEAGIKVHFQHYRYPVYEQLHGAFAERLSIIDLLMNCGPKSLQILRNE